MLRRTKLDDTVRMIKSTTVLGAGAGLLLSFLLTASATPANALSDSKIEDARYACVTFINSEAKHGRQKDIKRAQLARFWLISFLTGAYEADKVLEFSDQTETAEGDIVERVKEFCSHNRNVSIHAAAVNADGLPKPLPGVTKLGFDPRSYSCAAYSLGHGTQGNKKDQAEAVEFWAFAFVQGNISARYHSRLVISVSNKRKIVRALKRSCARNPTRNLLEQTAEIAGRVTPDRLSRQWD